MFYLGKMVHAKKIKMYEMKKNEPLHDAVSEMFDGTRGK